MDEELRRATEVCPVSFVVDAQSNGGSFLVQDYRARLQVMQQQLQKSPLTTSGTTNNGNSSTETASKVSALEKELQLARQKEEKLRKRQSDLEAVVQVLSQKYEKVITRLTALHGLK